MGRRYKNDTGPRYTAALGFLVTPADKAELQRRAKAHGCKVPEFARIVLLSDLKKPPPPPRYDPQAISDVTAEISRVGMRLNQLAKLANESRELPDKQTLDEVLQEVRTCLDKLAAL